MAALFYLASLCFYIKSRLCQLEAKLRHGKFYYILFIDNSYSRHVHQGNCHHLAFDDLAL